MTAEKFNTILDHTLEQAREVLGVKSAEYARNDDKLHNFRRGGES